MSASISECGAYRYDLHRYIGGLSTGNCLFIMLNPSTADATVDDPTIRRCMSFAHSTGHNRLTVVNLFAFRARDPKAMKAAADPVGPENDAAIMDAVYGAGTIVCAWGAHGGFMDRDRHVIDMVRKVMPDIYCLGTTKDGYPRHPLYLRRDAELIPYTGRAAAEQGDN